ncbi:MAG: L,D-transpeptidase family protein [Cohaesibacter sp.]|jgi:hypothetical protein|nr:L,D-transpeptidase family protein [Cohaesibacter sp.]
MSCKLGATAALAGLLLAQSALASETRPPLKMQDKEDNLPIQVVVSRADQTLKVYKGDQVIAHSPVSTGKKGHTTPTGVFSILEKRRRHFSNLYNNAPMPFMQRLTWSGIALHASNSVPRYPASHGCVRLPNSFAKTLFSLTERGAHVVISQREVAPEPIAHKNLFQPSNEMVEISRAKSMSPSVLGGDLMEEDLAQERKARYERSEMWRKVKAVTKHKSRKDKPLRILVTRRSTTTLVRDIQTLLNELGHNAGIVDGYVGRNTLAAVRSFNKAQGVETWNGKFDRALLQDLYTAAGKGEVPQGHIFIRQKFKPLFDAPIAFKNPEKPLGAHLFTLSKSDNNPAKTKWLALSLGDSINPAMQKRIGVEAIEQTDGLVAANDVLDRLIIPQEIREQIAPLLIAGSSLAISDKGLSRETTYQGTDFIVLTKPKGPDKKKRSRKKLAKRN